MQSNRIAQTIARTCVVIALCSVELGHPVASAQPPTGSPPARVDQQWWRIANAESGNAHAQRETQSAEAVQSIHVNLSDGTVAGMVTNLSPVTVKLKRNGVAIAASEGVPFFNGENYQYAITISQVNFPCANSATQSCSALISGDSIEIQQNGVIQTTTVPTLTAHADAVSNIVSGNAAPTQTVYAYAISGSAAVGAVFTRTVTSAASGDFQADFTGLIDLAASDSGFVVLRPSASSSFSIRYALPLLRFYVSRNWVSGLTTPANRVTLQFSRDMPGYVMFSDALGRFSQYLDGVQAGDTMTATFSDQIKHLTVQSITARLDGAQRVAGQTTPGQAVRIRRFIRTSFFDLLIGQSTWLNEETVTPDAGGRFTSTLTIDVDHAGLVTVADADGDESAVLIAMPTVAIRLGVLSNTWQPRTSSAIAVRDGAPNAVVTMTVRGPSGYAKTTWKPYSDSTGAAYSYDSAALQLRIVASDTVEVVQPDQVISVTMPVLTSARDAQTNKISGIAPPNAAVTLGVLTQQKLGGVFFVEQVHSLSTQADPDGSYQFDLNGRVSPAEYRQSIVAARFGAGHEAYRYVDVSDDASGCSGSIDEVEVRGSVAELSSTCQISNQRLRLIAPNGAEKAAASVDLYPYGLSRIDFSSFAANPIQILPGDRIELVGASTVTALVPNMSATIEASGTLRGQAPPGSELLIKVARPLIASIGYPNTRGIATYTGTADSMGGFVIPINPALAGTQAIIRAQTSSKPAWAIRTSVRQIVLQGGGANQFGSPGLGFALLQPMEPFTASITNNSIQFVTPRNAYFGTNDGPVNYYFSGAVKPGQTFQVTAGGQAMSITMPTVTAEYNAILRRVTGNAPAGARIELRLASYYYAEPSNLVTTANSDGRYRFDLAPTLTLFPELSHIAYIGPGGHEARVGFSSLPSFAVTLDDRCVVLLTGNRYDPSGNNVYSMTVTSAGGTVKASGAVTAFGENRGVCAAQPIISGDRVTLQPVAGEARTTVIPTLTTTYDPVNRVLTGRTVARMPLSLSLRNSFDSIIGLRTVDASADGSYGIDLSDLSGVTAPQTVISLIDENGNLIMRRVSIINNPRWLPIAFRNLASDGASPTTVPMPIPTGTPAAFPIPTFAPTAGP